NGDVNLQRSAVYNIKQANLAAKEIVERFDTLEEPELNALYKGLKRDIQQADAYNGILLSDTRYGSFDFVLGFCVAFDQLAEALEGRITLETEAKALDLIEQADLMRTMQE
ncbi:MAG: hypothetical protein AAGJ35_10160, partial [Myxococcota bacterium]